MLLCLLGGHFSKVSEERREWGRKQEHSSLHSIPLILSKEKDDKMPWTGLLPLWVITQKLSPQLRARTQLFFYFHLWQLVFCLLNQNSMVLGGQNVHLPQTLSSILKTQPGPDVPTEKPGCVLWQEPLTRGGWEHWTANPGGHSSMF
jgi:hypothetical protein